MVTDHTTAYIREQLRDINRALHDAYKMAADYPSFKLKVMFIRDHAQEILDIVNRIEGAKKAEQYIYQK